ncbi:IS110 family transposase [Candidatus Enterococcus murrayae]|uniref:IS110 family transposase n=1 Tax=Candidatus Enterococcus murrayae TaxID=2815321 RepID=A0ABS3HNL9_9ENTE|nr:IS110 family transposase [Enterococcus sp. MJM16]MBO0454928.1 IS110 family transposase [Enterococcus sp. MJM16]
MLYVGIDVAKHKHDLAVLDSDGTIFIRHLQIRNNREGFLKLQMTLSNLQKTTGEEIQIALEDTGHYCFNILRFLRTQGYPTFSYNPFLIKEFAKNQSLRKTKTDKKDAMTIARKLREDIDKQLFDTETIMIELKYATRHVSRIKEDCTRKKVNYTRILDIIFPELASFLGAPSAKHQSYVYAVLKEYPSANKLGNAHLTKLTNLVSQHSKGRLGKEQAIQLKELAQSSIGQESSALEFELLQTIDIIRYFASMRIAAEKEVNRLMVEIDSPILTIPGIGPALGSVILAEIRTIKNFRSPNQLLAYAGAEPSVSTSGMNQTESGYMVKRGSSQLRWALHEAARLMSIWSPSMREYYQKKRSEGKHYNVVISHVVRKLVRIIFRVLMYNESYDEVKMVVN